MRYSYKPTAKGENIVATFTSLASKKSDFKLYQLKFGPESSFRAVEES